MPHALHFLVLALAGWVTRHQEDRIDYLREENRVLREHLGPRPLRLTDAQRRRLALLHESSLARTMPTDRILTCRCDTTLVGRGRSSD